MTKKHRWRVCRRWHEVADAQSRGDQVYQHLLLWTQGPAAALAASRTVAEHAEQEVADANRGVCARVDPAASAKPEY